MITRTSCIRAFEHVETITTQNTENQIVFHIPQTLTNPMTDMA